MGVTVRVGGSSFGRRRGEVIDEAEPLGAKEGSKIRSSDGGSVVVAGIS